MWSYRFSSRFGHISQLNSIYWFFFKKANDFSYLTFFLIQLFQWSCEFIIFFFVDSSTSIKIFFKKGKRKRKVFISVMLNLLSRLVCEDWSAGAGAGTGTGTGTEEDRALGEGLMTHANWLSSMNTDTVCHCQSKGGFLSAEVVRASEGEKAVRSSFLD